MDPPPPLSAPTVHLQPVTLDHPPFAEMISAAITALNETDGSSKEAIEKYMETHYSEHLPPTHSTFLTHHLHRLTAAGHLRMLNNSYKLPSLAKRRPGRPPKPKPNAAVPVFPPPPSININDAPPENVVNGTPARAVRGRGRPPKSAKRGPGRPPKEKSADVVALVGQGKRPQERPPKPINIVEGFTAQPAGSAPTVVTGKRRGRPPKVATEAKKQRNLSGKPLGRPRKVEP